jgi:hypothetical protein
MRTTAAEDLRLLLRRFVDGQLGWEPFHRGFIDRFVRADARFHASADGRAWARIYGLVCGSLPDPLPAEVREAGVIGAEELRRRLATEAGT